MLLLDKTYTYTLSGNVKVYCRTRPLFEDEGPSIVEFPDDFTIRVNTGEDTITNPKKDFEFDRVYGPHVGQGEHLVIFPTEIISTAYANLAITGHVSS